MKPSGETFMREALRLAHENVENGLGGPFGAVIVRNGEIVGRGANLVTSKHDPTAHAEVTAIRNACEKLGTFSLAGCEIYTSCEPCPMCLAAIYWARLERIYYANTRVDAARIGFDDDMLYREISLQLHERTLPIELLAPSDYEAPFAFWTAKVDKTPY